ncbi:MAG: NAD(P)/FAD-dependent oxidoreductase [Pseudomonadota bacterium]
MRQYQVVILGAGVSGICMGIRLKAKGIQDFLILEQSERPGGTWQDNHYPGACCDIASHLYSFSFEPRPDWSRVYAPQVEIRDYLDHCVSRYELQAQLQCNARLESAAFDEAAGRWILELADGEQLAARCFVTAVGQLNTPYVPVIAGADSFEGASFHSARWDHSEALEGRRVAVIGNAASAIQFIPRVAAVAEQVYVYQRSANFILPRKDRAYSAKDRAAYARRPWRLKLSRLYWFLRQELLLFGGMFQESLRHKLMRRAARLHLENSVSDPALRRALSPDYPMGCKRILVSDDYYPTLLRDNVELVTAPISGMNAEGVVTDGAAREVDVVIYATGFHATEFLSTFKLSGRGGKALADLWRDGAWAHRGVSLPGFPNLFMLYGPNTNLGHNSIIYMVEGQVNYVLGCIDKMLAHQLRSLEVNADVALEHDDTLQRALAKTVWAGECGSWYENASGRITNNWPHSALRFRWAIHAPDFADFDMTV